MTNQVEKLANRIEKNTEQFSVKDIVTDLKNVMNNVTKTECSPATVNAACNCADKITNLLKLQLEYQRMTKR